MSTCRSVLVACLCLWIALIATAAGQPASPCNSLLSVSSIIDVAAGSTTLTDCALSTFDVTFRLAPGASLSLVGWTNLKQTTSTAPSVSFVPSAGSTALENVDISITGVNVALGSCAFCVSATTIAGLRLAVANATISAPSSACVTCLVATSVSWFEGSATDTAVTAPGFLMIRSLTTALNASISTQHTRLEARRVSVDFRGGSTASPSVPVGLAGIVGFAYGPNSSVAVDVWNHTALVTACTVTRAQVVQTVVTSVAGIAGHAPEGTARVGAAQVTCSITDSALTFASVAPSTSRFDAANVADAGVTCCAAQQCFLTAMDSIFAVENSVSTVSSRRFSTTTFAGLAALALSETASLAVSNVSATVHRSSNATVSAEMPLVAVAIGGAAVTSGGESSSVSDGFTGLVASSRVAVANTLYQGIGAALAAAAIACVGSSNAACASSNASFSVVHSTFTVSLSDKSTCAALGGICTLASGPMTLVVRGLRSAGIGVRVVNLFQWADIVLSVHSVTARSTLNIADVDIMDVAFVVKQSMTTVTAQLNGVQSSRKDVAAFGCILVRCIRGIANVSGVASVVEDITFSTRNHADDINAAAGSIAAFSPSDLMELWVTNVTAAVHRVSVIVDQTGYIAQVAVAAAISVGCGVASASNTVAAATVTNFASVASFVTVSAIARSDKHLSFAAVGGVAVSGFRAALTVQGLYHESVDCNATLAVDASRTIAVAIGGAVAVAGYTAFEAVLLDVNSNISRTTVDGGEVTQSIAFAVCGFAGVVPDGTQPWNNGTLRASNVSFAGDGVTFSHTNMWHSAVSVFSLVLYIHQGANELDVYGARLSANASNITVTNSMFGCTAVAGLLSMAYSGSTSSNVSAVNVVMDVSASTTVTHLAPRFSSLSLASVVTNARQSSVSSRAHNVSCVVHDAHVSSVASGADTVIVGVAAIVHHVYRLQSIVFGFQAFVLQSTIVVMSAATVSVGGVASNAALTIESTGESMSLSLINSSAVVRLPISNYNAAVAAVSACAFAAQAGRLQTTDVAVHSAGVTATVCDSQIRVSAQSFCSVAAAGGIAAVASDVAVSAERSATAMSNTLANVTFASSSAVAIAGLAVFSTASTNEAIPTLPVLFSDVNASIASSILAVVSSINAAIAVCGMSICPAGDAAVHIAAVKLAVLSSSLSFSGLGTSATSIAAISVVWVSGRRGASASHVDVREAVLLAQGSAIQAVYSGSRSAFGTAGLALVRADDGPTNVTLNQVIAGVKNVSVAGRWPDSLQSFAVAGTSGWFYGPFNISQVGCAMQVAGGTLTVFIPTHVAAVVSGLAIRAMSRAGSVLIAKSTFSLTHQASVRVDPVNDLASFSATAFAGVAAVLQASGPSEHYVHVEDSDFRVVDSEVSITTTSVVPVALAAVAAYADQTRFQLTLLRVTLVANSTSAHLNTSTTTAVAGTAITTDGHYTARVQIENVVSAVDNVSATLLSSGPRTLIGQSVAGHALASDSAALAVRTTGSQMTVHRSTLSLQFPGDRVALGNKATAVAVAGIALKGSSAGVQTNASSSQCICHVSGSTVRVWGPNLPASAVVAVAGLAVSGYSFTFTESRFAAMSYSASDSSLSVDAVNAVNTAVVGAHWAVLSPSTSQAGPATTDSVTVAVRNCSISYAGGAATQSASIGGIVGFASVQTVSITLCSASIAVANRGPNKYTSSVAYVTTIAPGTTQVDGDNVLGVATTQIIAANASCVQFGAGLLGRFSVALDAVSLQCSAVGWASGSASRIASTARNVTVGGRPASVKDFPGIVVPADDTFSVPVFGSLANLTNSSFCAATVSILEPPSYDGDRAFATREAITDAAAVCGDAYDRTQTASRTRSPTGGSTTESATYWDKGASRTRAPNSPTPAQRIIATASFADFRGGGRSYSPTAPRSPTTTDALEEPPEMFALSATKSATPDPPRAAPSSGTGAPAVMITGTVPVTVATAASAALGLTAALATPEMATDLQSIGLLGLLACREATSGAVAAASRAVVPFELEGAGAWGVMGGMAVLLMGAGALQAVLLIAGPYLPKWVLKTPVEDR
jgi:hypothetical protein